MVFKIISIKTYQKTIFVLTDKELHLIKDVTMSLVKSYPHNVFDASSNCVIAKDFDILAENHAAILEEL